MNNRCAKTSSASLYPFISLVLVFIFLTGCAGLAPSIDNFPTPSPTPSLELGTPVFTPTDAPVEPPTATPPPVVNNPAEAASSPTPVIQVVAPTTEPTAAPLPTGNFALASGSTAGVLNGTIHPGEVITYSFSATQGQPLVLVLASNFNDATLAVSAPNGDNLLDPADKNTAWQAELPEAGLYNIEVIGGAALQAYSLTIKLPQVVSITAGSTTSTLNGLTVNGDPYYYSINLPAGQALTASLNVPSTSASLSVSGLNTGPITGASAGGNTWTGALPQTQDYIVEVKPAGSQSVNFALTLSLSAAAPGAVASSSGGEITFYKGGTAATMLGTIQPGQVISYTVQGGRVQPMILRVESPKNDVVLSVIDPNGVVMLDPSQKWSRWQWKLPVTGTYTIKLVGGAATADYTLTVKIAQIVYFDPGVHTVTKLGQTDLGLLLSYAVYGNEGDSMTVSIDLPADKAYLDVFGMQTGLLLDYNLHATSATVTFPKSQWYVVEVIPRGGGVVTFHLTISK
jgi:hypothetical protein